MLLISIQVTCIILAILLIVLVILQQGKGSDLGSAFGGGSSNSMFGAVGPSNFLSKLTSIIAALFLILSFTQAYIIKQEFGGGTFENVSQNEESDKSEPENPVAPTG
tara:strand:+ start:1188 stop:1508 length:321 start_codon:yes stop_codon:yes gene_type:complete